MSPIAEKHKNTVEEAIEHLISRAENVRGLRSEDVAARVGSVADAYAPLGTFDVPRWPPWLCVVRPICGAGDDCVYRQSIDAKITRAGCRAATGVIIQRFCV